MGKLNTDRIIGLSAMLISLLTLCIFVYQTNIIRTQSRLSVTPRLDFSTSLDRPDSTYVFSTFILNKGLGPGIIESVEIIYKGKKYPLNFPKFYKEAFPDYKNYGYFIQNMTLSKGTTISEKESFKLATFSFHKDKLKPLMEYMGSDGGDKMPYDIEVTYSSIYEEKWKTRLNIKGHPIKL